MWECCLPMMCRIEAVWKNTIENRDESIKVCYNEI